MITLSSLHLPCLRYHNTIHDQRASKQPATTIHSKEHSQITGRLTPIDSFHLKPPLYRKDLSGGPHVCVPAGHSRQNSTKNHCGCSNVVHPLPSPQHGLNVMFPEFDPIQFQSFLRKSAQMYQLLVDPRFHAQQSVRNNAWKTYGCGYIERERRCYACNQGSVSRRSICQESVAQSCSDNKFRRGGFAFVVHHFELLHADLYRCRFQCQDTGLAERPYVACIDAC